MSLDQIPTPAEPGDEPKQAPVASDTLFDAPPMAEQERMVEAILFASAEPMSLAQIGERLPHGSEPAEALELLRKRYEGRGVTLAKIGTGWAFRTSPDLGFLMRREAREVRKLSRAAIETLAIIAYHQPATRAEIEEIRGVSLSRGTIDILLELEWIKLGRRRETPGRPGHLRDHADLPGPLRTGQRPRPAGREGIARCGPVGIHPANGRDRGRSPARRRGRHRRHVRRERNVGRDLSRRQAAAG